MIARPGRPSAKRSRAKASALSATFALGATLLAVPASAQNYRNHFAAGVQALARQDWDQAFEEARLALVERSAAEARLVEIEGIGPRPYTPHLLLGLAAHRRADCAVTVQAYVNSVTQRVGPVLAPNDFARLREGREACAAAGNGVQLAAADAIADALMAYAAANDLRGGEAQAHWRSDPRWQQTFEEATRGLEFGHNLLVLSVQGTGASEDLQSATAVAQRSRSQFRALEKAVGDAAVRRANDAIASAWDRADEVGERRRTVGDTAWAAQPELEQRSATARTQLEEAETTLGSALGPARVTRALSAVALAEGAATTLADVLAESAGLPAASGTARSAGGRASESTERSTPSEVATTAPTAAAPLPEARSPATDAPTPSEAPAGEASREPEPRRAADPAAALRAGAEAYFRADYRSALETLQGGADGPEEVRLQAHLLRAAASFALFRLEGDEPLLEQARDEVAAIRLLDAEFRPPAAYYPPSFLDLFER